MAAKTLFQKLPIHWMWWPMLGGVVVGIGGLDRSAALGVGYDNIAQMLRGDMASRRRLAAAGGESRDLGGRAGLRHLGRRTGAAFDHRRRPLGRRLAHLLPAAGPGFWALLGMAATMGGTMRSPLTAIFFATEVTGDTHVLLPLATACVTAHLVTVLLMRRSILTEKIARRGHHLLREYRVDPFALTRVGEVMTGEVETLPDTMTLHEVTAFLTLPTTRHPSFPVIDAERRVVGIMDPPAVLAWRRSGHHRRTTLAALLDRTTVPAAYPDEYLESVIERMSRRNVAHLAVLSRADATLVGYLGWRDLLRVQTHLRHQDRNRTAFFPWPRLRRRVARRPAHLADEAITEARG